MNDLIKIQKFEVEIQNASSILAENKTSVTRAKTYGESLLENFSKGISDQTYKAGLEYLSKVQKTVKSMNEKRKPITQLLNDLAKQFTTLEAELSATGDTIPAKVKAKLDEYAAELIRKQKQQEAELERKRREGLQMTELEAEVKNIYLERYYTITKDAVRQLSTIWNSITLENFDEVSAIIVDATYPIDQSFFSYQSLTMVDRQKYSLLPEPVISQTYAKILDEVYSGYVAEFQKQFEQMKNEIVAQFDRRYQELQEMSKASTAEAERLRLQAIEEEKLRVAEQQARIEADKKAQVDAVQNAKIASNITNLFDTAQPVAEIKVKEVAEINVTNPAGWIELVLFYFEHEGNKLSLEKLEKKFGFAKKFAESKYMKDDIKIHSKHLQYVETAKAK